MALPEVVDVGLEVNGDMRLLFGKIFDSCLGDIWCQNCWSWSSRLFSGGSLAILAVGPNLLRCSLGDMMTAFEHGTGSYFGVMRLVLVYSQSIMSWILGLRKIRFDGTFRLLCFPYVIYKLSVLWVSFNTCSSSFFSW